MQNSIVRTTGQTSLTAYRDLLFAWTLRTIRARYQQSILGVFWAVLQPAATVIVFSILFTQVIPIRTGDTAYILFSSVAMVPWTFFTTSLSDMVISLVSNLNLVTKVYFPREILLIAALLSRLVDFLIAGVMVVLLMIYFREPFFLFGWLFLPVIVLVQMALSLGIGLIASALNVFYRDVRHVIALALQLWFYASPVVYPIDRIPERFQDLYFLNPMAGIIKAYRDVLLDQTLPDYTLLISAAAALLLLATGYWFFKRVEFNFADVV